MGVSAGGLEDLDGANLDVNLAVDAVGAFAGAVLQAELEGVDAEASGELVDDLLRGKSNLGSAGGAVGCRAGLVDHHAVTVDTAIGDVVGGEDAGGGDAVRSAGVGARGEGELGLGGDEGAVGFGAEL